MTNSSLTKWKASVFELARRDRSRVNKPPLERRSATETGLGVDNRHNRRASRSRRRP
jgi:hypothetical protein